MKAVFLIAINTLKETVRNKVLYSILFFATVLIVLSISFGEWSVLARIQVMQDFGLGTMSLSGLLLSVFIGVGLLGREISSKTCYYLLTKSVSRTQFLWGKFLGLLGTLTLIHIFMTLFLFFVLWLLGGAFKVSILLAIVLIWAEMAMLVAVSIMFSTLSNPILAAMYTLGFYIAGHFNDLMEIELLRKENPLLIPILRLLYYIVPNLDHFDIRTQIVYNIPFSVEYVFYSFIYGCLYTTLFVVIASLIFHRKDL